MNSYLALEVSGGQQKGWRCCILNAIPDYEYLRGETTSTYIW